MKTLKISIEEENIILLKRAVLSKEKL